jgi:purine-nucleoside phosphorylase
MNRIVSTDTDRGERSLADETLSSTSQVGNADGREYFARMEEAAENIRSRVQTVPKILIILGSGLGGVVDAVENQIVLPYASIPKMPEVATEGHAGNLVIGSLNGTDVSVFAGRVHCHDGYHPREVAFGARVMALLGVETLIVTNAAGYVNEAYRPGDFMVIENHISLLLGADAPTRGLDHPQLGTKFPAQSFPYDRDLGDAFMQLAKERQIRCQRGVYTFAWGPQYESAADIVMLRNMGTDAVGMSTVPEVLAFLQQVRALGGTPRVLGITTLTNPGAGISIPGQDVVDPNHAEVKEEGDKAGVHLQALISDILPKL